MEVLLYREDLKPEYKEISCRDSRFDHFNETAQQVIRLVGRAVFHDDDRFHSYNAIFPQKVSPASEECVKCGHLQVQHQPLGCSGAMTTANVLSGKLLCPCREFLPKLNIH